MRPFLAPCQVGKIHLYAWFWMGQSLGDKVAAQSFAPALKTLQKIKILRLKSNSVTAVGAREISSALMGKTMTEFYIGNNAIGDQGVSDLSRAIQTWPRVSHLHFLKTGVGNAGINALARALMGKGTLRYVSLNTNNISDVKALGKALHQNPMMEFHLGVNPIGDGWNRTPCCGHEILGQSFQLES